MCYVFCVVAKNLLLYSRFAKIFTDREDSIDSILQFFNAPLPTSTQVQLHVGDPCDF